MHIVDTHCHLIYREALSYPWLASAPPLDRDFTFDQYLAEARPAGIATTVHMEVDVAEGDIERETGFIGGLGVDALVPSCRPESPDFPAYLERAVTNPKVKGFRRVLHVVPDEVSRAPLFRENLRRLGERNLPFDLCVRADQLPIGLELAKACPRVQFILDHCGVPNVKDRDLDPWRANITALSALPNVACKVSGIVAYADPRGWTVAELRPFFDHVVAAFGWGRVVWGSDWPVCTLAADLTRWVAATHELLAGASLDEKRKLLSGNAGRLYRLV